MTQPIEQEKPTALRPQPDPLQESQGGGTFNFRVIPGGFLLAIGVLCMTLSTQAICNGDFSWIMRELAGFWELYAVSFVGLISVVTCIFQMVCCVKRGENSQVWGVAWQSLLLGVLLATVGITIGMTNFGLKIAGVGYEILGFAGILVIGASCPIFVIAKLTKPSSRPESEAQVVQPYEKSGSE